jgi:hypothetical protein
MAAVPCCTRAKPAAQAEELQQQRSDTATIIAKPRLFICQTDLPRLGKINIPKKVSILGSQN